MLAGSGNTLAVHQSSLYCHGGHDDVHGSMMCFPMAIAVEDVVIEATVEVKAKMDVEQAGLLDLHPFLSW